MKKNNILNDEANRDAAEILMKLMARHGFLQPANKDFDVWDRKDAANLVADLIEELNKSEAIWVAHDKTDWGK